MGSIASYACSFFIHAEGPTGYFGLRQEKAIKDFQKNNGLKIDGIINPGGPTIGALMEKTSKKRVKASSKSVDPYFSIDVGEESTAIPMPEPDINSRHGYKDTENSYDTNNSISADFPDTNEESKDENATAKENAIYDAEANRDRQFAALEEEAKADRNMTSVQYLPKKEAIHAEYTAAVKSIEKEFGEKDGVSDVSDHDSHDADKPSDIAQKLIDNPTVPPTAPPEIQISKEIFKNGMIEDLEKHEFNTEHLYLDSNGNPTIGIGNHVETKAEYAELPLTKKDGTLATTKEKEAEYDRMMGVKKQMENDKASFNKHYSTYKEHTVLKLDKDFSREKAKEHVLENVKSLLNKMPNFENAPMQAKKALTEMEFNMGSGKFTDKDTVPVPWKNLFKAVKDGDWKTAANECKRGGISADRNNWAKEMFLNAATVAKAEKTKGALSKIVSQSHKNKQKGLEGFRKNYK